MIRKVILSIAAAVVLVAGFSVVAQEVKKQQPAEKTKAKQEVKAAQEAKELAIQRPKQERKDLLEELKEAYKADDKVKMGQIIEKMEQRREKVREAIKNRRAEGQFTRPGWGGAVGRSEGRAWGGAMAGAGRRGAGPANWRRQHLGWGGDGSAWGGRRFAWGAGPMGGPGMNRWASAGWGHGRFSAQGAGMGRNWAGPAMRGRFGEAQAGWGRGRFSGQGPEQGGNWAGHRMGGRFGEAPAAWGHRRMMGERGEGPQSRWGQGGGREWRGEQMRREPEDRPHSEWDW